MNAVQRFNPTRASAAIVVLRDVTEPLAAEEPQTA